MNLQQLSETLNLSESYLKKDFPSVVNRLQKMRGITVIKEGRGKNADYQIVEWDGVSFIPKKDTDYGKKLIGKRYGHLVVIEDTGKRKHRSIVWKCQCDCGNYTEVTTNHLNNGNVKTCAQDNCKYHRTYEDLTNKKFGKLTPMYPTSMKDGSHMYWVCKCDCGNEKEVASSCLKSGNVQSCGCIKTSIGELNIINLLTKNNIPFKTQIAFNDLKNIKPLRYDFGIYNNEGILVRLIEFDGIQHYEEQTFFTHNLTETKKNDKIKNEYCKNNNIPLVRIPYWERDKITLDMLMGGEYLI